MHKGHIPHETSLKNAKITKCVIFAPKVCRSEKASLHQFINEVANATGHGIVLVVRSFKGGAENGGDSYSDFLIMLLMPPTAAVTAGPSPILDMEC